jgi:hypothetical protein
MANRKLAIASVVVAALIIALGFMATSADSHSAGNCRHHDYFWTVYPPSGHPIYYEEAYLGYNGVGPHWHSYGVYMKGASTHNVWVAVHAHTRQCSGHAT